MLRLKLSQQTTFLTPFLIGSINTPIFLTNWQVVLMGLTVFDSLGGWKENARKRDTMWPKIVTLVAGWQHTSTLTNVVVRTCNFEDACLAVRNAEYLVG